MAAIAIDNQPTEQPEKFGAEVTEQEILAPVESLTQSPGAEADPQAALTPVAGVLPTAQAAPPVAPPLWGGQANVGFASVAYESRDLTTRKPARLTTQAALDLRLAGLRQLPLAIDLRLGLGLRALWLTQPDNSGVALQQGDWLLPRLVGGVDRHFGQRGSLGLAVTVERELFVTAVSTQVLGAQPRWLVTPQLVGALQLLGLPAWRLGLGGFMGYVVGVGDVNSGLSFAADLRGTRVLSEAWALILALGYGQKSQSTSQVQQADRYLTANLSAEWRG